MGIIAWIVFGGLAGWVASLILIDGPSHTSIRIRLGIELRAAELETLFKVLPCVGAIFPDHVKRSRNRRNHNHQ